MIGLTFLYRRGYLNCIKRKIKAIDKRKISYPQDDKSELPRFATPDYPAPLVFKKAAKQPFRRDSASVTEWNVSVESFRVEPQWTTPTNPVNILGISAGLDKTEGWERRNAPLPPTPAAANRDSVSTAGVTDWSSMIASSNRVMEDPFVENGRFGARGTLSEFDRALTTERQQVRTGYLM